jgi:hypothetical protein
MSNISARDSVELSVQYAVRHISSVENVFADRDVTNDRDVLSTRVFYALRAASLLATQLESDSVKRNARLHELLTIAASQ